MLGEAHAGNGTTIRGAPVPRMTVDGYNETRGSALQRLTSVLTNARSQVASEVRKRMYSRRLGSARYPQIPAVLPGAAGKRRQGPVSSDRTPVALRVAQDLRRNTAAPRPSLRGKTVRMQCCWMWASLRRAASCVRFCPQATPSATMEAPSGTACSIATAGGACVAASAAILIRSLRRSLSNVRRHMTVPVTDCSHVHAS